MEQMKSKIIRSNITLDTNSNTTNNLSSILSVLFIVTNIKKKLFSPFFPIIFFYVYSTVNISAPELSNALKVVEDVLRNFGEVSRKYHFIDDKQSHFRVQKRFF